MKKLFADASSRNNLLLASAKDLASVGQEACTNINALFEDMSEVAAKGQIKKNNWNSNEPTRIPNTLSFTITDNHHKTILIISAAPNQNI